MEEELEELKNVVEKQTLVIAELKEEIKKLTKLFDERIHSIHYTEPSTYCRLKDQHSNGY